jgi:hypothetical protein
LGFVAERGERHGLTIIPLGERCASHAATHDRLARELAVGSGAALAFVEYPNSPEARYPVALEQGYATAQWLIRNGADTGLDGTGSLSLGTRSAATWPPCSR